MSSVGADAGHRIEHAVESTAAKAISRWVVPVLLTIIGFFLVKVLDTQQKQGDDLAAVKQQLAVLNTMLAERVIRDVDKQGQDIEDLKKRVGALERSK